jgi:hypothetical protein
MGGPGCFYLSFACDADLYAQMLGKVNLGDFKVELAIIAAAILFGLIAEKFL